MYHLGLWRKVDSVVRVLAPSGKRRDDCVLVTCGEYEFRFPICCDLPVRSE